MGKAEEISHLAGAGVTLQMQSSTLLVDGKRLEVLYCSQDSAAGTILLIHEALGSVSYWKDFPETLASATGLDVIAYSRAGHGNSEGPVEPRSLDYYRKQVEVVLPAILSHFSVAEPVLYGHSEGAGIALLYAAMRHPVRAIIAECPIVAPEKTTADTIRQLEAGYASSDMGRRLARYHANPDEVFYSWIQSNRAAFSKEFPFEEYLKAVTCPLLVLQGDHDEFGSVLQFEIIRRYVPQAQHAVFEAGHLLHREVPELVVSHATSFLQALPRSSSALQPYTKHQFLQE